MGKSASATAPPAPAPSVLRLEPGATLSVQLLPPPQEPPRPRRWRGWLIGGLIFVGVLVFFLSLFVLPRVYVDPVAVSGIPELSISLTYPTYLAFGDTGVIDVTVINNGSAMITGTMVLTFTDVLPVQAASPKITAVSLPELPGGARLTERMSIAWGRFMWFRAENVPFQVLIETDGQRGTLPASQLIRAAPVPFLRTIFDWLTRSSLLAGLLAFVWEQIKPRLAGRRER